MSDKLCECLLKQCWKVEAFLETKIQTSVYMGDVDSLNDAFVSHQNKTMTDWIIENLKQRKAVHTHKIWKALFWSGFEFISSFPVLLCLLSFAVYWINFVHLIDIQSTQTEKIHFKQINSFSFISSHKNNNSLRIIQ